jgi:hypothetical protein
VQDSTAQDTTGRGSGVYLGRGEKSWVHVERRASSLDPSPMVNSGLLRMLLSLMVRLIRWERRWRITVVSGEMGQIYFEAFASEF